MTLGNFMKRFFSHYLPVQKGLSPNTLAAYRDALKLLLRYAADTLRKPVDKLTVDDMTEKVVLGFLDYVQAVRSCSARTRNARLAAIHSLFAFIAREEPEFRRAMPEDPRYPSKTHRAQNPGLPRGKGNASHPRCGTLKLPHRNP